MQTQLKLLTQPGSAAELMYPWLEISLAHKIVTMKSLLCIQLLNEQ